MHIPRFSASPITWVASLIFAPATRRHVSRHDPPCASFTRPIPDIRSLASRFIVYPIFLLSYRSFRFIDLSTAARSYTHARAHAHAHTHALYLSPDREYRDNNSDRSRDRSFLELCYRRPLTRSNPLRSHLANRWPITRYDLIGIKCLLYSLLYGYRNGVIIVIPYLASKP